jgi:hypothetical protein
MRPEHLRSKNECKKHNIILRLTVDLGGNFCYIKRKN